MSIRRIGGFPPPVQTANLIDAQRRVHAVEKHAGTDDPELMTEEQALEALNARHQAELEALEAERSQRERETEELRAKLLLTDGFERPASELVDLKGGAAEEAVVAPEPGEGKAGVSLARLARASVYESVSRAERAAAERAALAQAEAERATAASVDGGSGVGGEDNWMEAELSALQSELDELEGLDGAEEAHSDPGADSFFASLEDIENLEQGGGDLDDAGADAFVASLDDIAHLVSESAPEAVPEPVLAAVPEPMLDIVPEPASGARGPAGVEPAAAEPERLPAASGAERSDHRTS